MIMKKTDLAKFNNRSAEELHKEVVELKEKIWELRREIAGGKVKNVHAKSIMRRDVARLLTLATAKTSQKNLPVKAK